MRDIDMSTKYEPTSVESGRYDTWQAKNYLPLNRTRPFKETSQLLMPL
ncbi:hypothetical protein ACG92U_09765 [Leuconostoc citreum]